MPHTVTLEELKDYEGRELSPSDWIDITQERIDRFADCTDDHQYIHVDPERMKDYLRMYHRPRFFVPFSAVRAWSS